MRSFFDLMKSHRVSFKTFGTDYFCVRMKSRSGLFPSHTAPVIQQTSHFVSVQSPRVSEDPRAPALFKSIWLHRHQSGSPKKIKLLSIQVSGIVLRALLMDRSSQTPARWRSRLSQIGAPETSTTLCSHWICSEFAVGCRKARADKIYGWML